MQDAGQRWRPTGRTKEGGGETETNGQSDRQTDRRVKENVRDSNSPIRNGSMDWELYRARNYSLAWCAFEPQHTLASLAVSFE